MAAAQIPQKKYDVAVIGAGPAGMIAAIRAAQLGARVVVLEKKQTAGLKLLMTGKERCNITHDEPDARTLAQAYGANGKFLLSALFAFGVNETLDFFHQHGLTTKVERGGRIFPQSEKAQDVQALLLRLMKKRGVELRLKAQIKKIELNGSRIARIQLQDGEAQTEKIILATGGLSYPKTGATGDGYAWAKKLGHTIIEPIPALTPILVKEPYIKDLQGISLKNVSIALFQNGAKQDERFGEALFMDNGLSGPIVLDLSKKAGELLKTGKVTLHIDFKPALDMEKLDNRLIRDFEKFNTKKIQNAMQALVPKRLIPIILEQAEIDPDKWCNSISKKERKRLRLVLKGLRFQVNELVGFKKAVVTAGGVSLKEIDPKSMRSKIIDNLYFAGEILDLDGPTGGYNLQAAWSTGWLAGESAAQSWKEQNSGRIYKMSGTKNIL